jgi:predicted MFS family arabinose efflux permease
METISAIRENSYFQKLWGASGISNLADGIGLTAAPLLAASLSRDPLLVAGLTIAQRLPWFLFTLISGALVDRLDRRRVMQNANAWRFILLGMLAVMALTNRVTLPVLYLIFFLLGTIETLFDNAALAILPHIVPKDKLEEANGRLFATGSLANELVGPPLGSYLFSLIKSTAFFSSALAYGLSSILISRIPGQYSSNDVHRPEGILREIREGLRWFWQHRLLRTLGFFAGTFNFVSAATLSVFVLFSQDVLGISEAAYGLLLSFGALGGIAGSLLVKGLSDQIGAGRVLFFDAFISGLAFIGMSLTTNPLVVGFMFVLISMTNMFGNVILISLRQAIIPDQLLGRVASAYRLVVLGALPLGAIFGGVMARAFSLSTPFAVGGLLLILVGFAMQPIVNNRTIQVAKEGAKAEI